MSLEDYNKAYKLGKRDYQSRVLRGEQPTLRVLDDILPPKGEYSEIPLGVVSIPMEQIVGTKNAGRSNAFSANFMPILEAGSEFARKWSLLSTSHVEEGIREPIKAYEYMNQFYVEEGNKRVSVMRFFDVLEVPGSVTRILPKRSEEKENKIYYEFVDFYDKTKINYIWFSKLGSFQKLVKAVGKAEDEIWNEEERRNFSSVYRRFLAEYRSQGGEKLKITAGDAFLAFISLHGYEGLLEKSIGEMKALIMKTWEEFVLLNEQEDVDLKMHPTKEKKKLFDSLLSFGKSRLKVGFIYEKTATSSAWTYAHELGRLHLEQMFPDEVSTIYYDNVTGENAEEFIQKCVDEGCDIVFTTTPAFVQASVRKAIEHPSVRIVNCSLNTSHRYIRTYYARMYEAKFLMGAIAGAMAENNKIVYLADYPIYGTIANINAFALGAKMINPRAEVNLLWSCVKEQNIQEEIKKISPDCISGKDMVIPEEVSRYFGVFRIQDEEIQSIAMPLWHWGKFYEQLIRTIMDGTWKYDESSGGTKAINYWWGMSADVIDLICSQNLPIGTKRLVKFLKAAIRRGDLNPFYGILYSQTGIVQDDAERSLTPEEIIKMDWLAENVIGSIPKEEELEESSKPVVRQQGVDIEKG